MTDSLADIEKIHALALRVLDTFALHKDHTKRVHTTSFAIKGFNAENSKKLMAPVIQTLLHEGVQSGEELSRRILAWERVIDMVDKRGYPLNASDENNVIPRLEAYLHDMYDLQMGILEGLSQLIHTPESTQTASVKPRKP